MLGRYWQELPRLIRFMIRHFAIGMGLGWACALMVIWYDVGGIGSLLARQEGVGLMALFFIKGGLYFGTMATGVAVMNLRRDETGGSGPGRGLLSHILCDPFGIREKARLKVRHTAYPAAAGASNTPRNLGKASG
ncbi:hypothetical protein [Natronohydrobacter thiooxidans]|jgi:hypothetical protein|uniref:hypothetical protein n=1 Tax=Natronohydrobacter thiooxidans TaxID=87172 RepID=UPI001114E198|nr:hypothetical protein [Natronohydrobacter thiooxidans]